MKRRKKVDLVRIELVKEGSIPYGESDNENTQITKVEDAVHLASSLFERADREKVYVIALDGHMNPRNISLAGVGGMAECAIHVPEIFKAAILSNCSNIICIHNHPSGNVEPSESDRRVTRRLKEAGQLLGVKLQDHIIIGDNGNFFSFKQERMRSEQKGQKASMII